MNIKIKGSKLIIFFDEEEIKEIREDLESKTIDIIWTNLFYNDVYSLGNNSDYDYWCPDSLMHEYCGALTSSPLITKGAIMDDKGDISDVEIISWFPNYQVENEFNQLPEIIFDIA